jgi:hypothetical protein
MTEPARKPDIRELVGIAVNTSALTLPRATSARSIASPRSAPRRWR